MSFVDYFVKDIDKQLGKYYKLKDKCQHKLTQVFKNVDGYEFKEVCDYCGKLVKFKIKKVI